MIKRRMRSGIGNVARETTGKARQGTMASIGGKRGVANQVRITTIGGTVKRNSWAGSEPTTAGSSLETKEKCRAAAIAVARRMTVLIIARDGRFSSANVIYKWGCCSPDLFDAR